MTSPDTIVAAATVPTGGGRGIVRLCGDGTEAVLAAIVAPDPPGFAHEGEPPRLVNGRLRPDGLGRDWGAVPVAILHWPGPAGPVGGPLAELQLPGAPALVDAVVTEACRLGARLARGGEFSLRGFLAGRLDILQAEAVLAVVDARTPAELSSALDRMAGGIGRALESLRQELLDLVADVEAAIDFADEAAPDAVPVAVPWDSLERRIGDLAAVVASLAARLAGRDATAAESQPRAVFVGRPNIGKSSLFNALVGRDAALVADESGTTRDWIAARLADGADGTTGAACLVIDVAGVAGDGPFPESDAPAAAAAQRAVEEIARADIVILCRDAGDAAIDELHRLRADARRIEVVTRCDRAAAPACSAAALATSAVSGQGVERLRQVILQAAGDVASDRAPATQRMRSGIALASRALDEAFAAVAAARAGAGDEAIVAGCLHQAIDAIGDVTGAALGTDLLDRIFSRHCIGK